MGSGSRAWLVLLALVLASHTSAQPLSRSCDNPQALLHAPSLADKAWGAHLAVVCRRPDLAVAIGEQLIDLQLEPRNSYPPNSEDFWIGPALLDSLIQLNQPLHAAFVQSLIRPYPTEAAILMLQFADANREGLFLLRTGGPHGMEWVAATQALVGMRTPGIAATLLKELLLHNRVVVTDTGTAPPTGIAGSLLGSEWKVKVPYNFPPVALYDLTPRHSLGDKPIVRGPDPLYVQRTQFESGIDRVWTPTPVGFDFDSMRIGYLATLAKLPANTVTDIIQKEGAVRWSSVAALKLKVGRSVDTQELQLRRLCQILIHANLLSASELDKTFVIGIAVQDDRRNPAPLLPSFEPRYFRLP